MYIINFKNDIRTDHDRITNLLMLPLCSIQHIVLIANPLIYSSFHLLEY